jgi:hypothetical protein
MRVFFFRKRYSIGKRLLVLSAAATLLGLVGCATPPPQTETRKPGDAKSAPGSAPPPGFAVRAPLAAALSSVILDGEEYFAVLHKVTFTYSVANGIAKLSLRDAHEADQLELGAITGTGCTERGAALNDQTVDYPYAAVLARGLELLSVRMPRANAPLVILPLSQGDVPTQAIYTGPGRHDVEFAYETCVGPNRADGFGHRLLTFMPSDAMLSFQSLKTKQLLEVKLDGRFTPYVQFRFNDGKIAAAPSRMVLLTIDEERRRINVYYRSLFRANAAIEAVELRAVLPSEFGGTPLTGETASQFRDRSERMLVHLANCDVPAKYGEICAEAARALP